MGSSHVFSEIFIHVNWHCINDNPMISGAIEPELFSFMKEYCANTKGVHLLALNGTETHVHMAFQMEPFVHLSDFIGRIKGASGHLINQRFSRKALVWQRGYGVVSFSKRHAKTVIEYVQRQKEHHGHPQGLIPVLEAGCNADEDFAEAIEKPR